MTGQRFKSFAVAVFSTFCILFSGAVNAQHNGTDATQQKEEQTTTDHEGEKGKFDAGKLIFGHVLNGHEFHFMNIGETPISIPLPVILYSPQRGFTGFMSSKFSHGHEDYKQYRMLTEHSIAEMGLDPSRYLEGDIVPVTASGQLDSTVKVYDLSLTRNVVQMFLALILFVWVMIRIAKRYKKGIGVTSAPKGSQSLLEPVIEFVRDEVAIPNLGRKYPKYLPFLLALFFFILINNLFGLVPGSANVSGNIAFTLVLGVVFFIVLLFSSNKHYWLHIFNPPGIPLGVKFILVPVEILSLFIKPLALIIRLFANMVAGHIIIICLISLIFIFSNLSLAAGWGSAPFSVAFTIFIYFIEILVAFIQAFIFAMLSAVFIGQALEGEHHEDEHLKEDLHLDKEVHLYDDAVIV